jgi:hypothetical protein
LKGALIDGGSGALADTADARPEVITVLITVEPEESAQARPPRALCPPQPGEVITRDYT